jgi:tetrapyrrole methylase family protein/MazG family protein
MNKAKDSFEHLYDVVRRLRGPGGCPWDIEQSPSTLRGDLLEETYECIEAIDEGNAAHIKEELGDIFLLVTMISYMHEEENKFSLSEVLEGLCDKLIRRHPHVFSDVKVKDSEEVLQNWAKIKIEQEGRAPKDSVLDEVPRAFPALERAYKLQKKAAKSGFDWPDIEGVYDKIDEELAEVKEAAAAATAAATAAAAATAQNVKIEGELGDLLFSVVNLCRVLHVDPALALSRTNVKFTERFKHVEKRMKENNLSMSSDNLNKMDEYWNEAKRGI